MSAPACTEGVVGCTAHPKKERIRFAVDLSPAQWNALHTVLHHAIHLSHDPDGFPLLSGRERVSARTACTSLLFQKRQADDRKAGR